MRRSSRGVTLIDTVVGTALMLVVFLGIAAAFQLSVDVVENNKARSGAIALATERMEYIRSLSYSAIGTVGGVPSGNLAQSESLSLNGVSYTRRTLIVYGDDPYDGTGSADTNNIPEDYKAAKVEVSWNTHAGTRSVELVTRIEPPNGEEVACTSCGTLTVKAVDANSSPLAGASVSIVNASASPAVDLNTFTDANGSASLIGAPAATGYSIIVSKSGYSTARTYDITATNTDPTPGNLTVSNGQTTSGTFAIDVLGTISVRTWTTVQDTTWSDTFANTGNIATSTNVTVASSSAALDAGQTSGDLEGVPVQPTDLVSWKSADFTDTVPTGTSVTYHVMDGSGTLLPDTALPGNSTGFTTSPIDLSGVSTSTYPVLQLYADLAGGSAQPAVDSWDLAYSYGPEKLPSVDFKLTGAKTIGSLNGNSIPKYSNSFNSGTGASIDIPNLEWDTYTIASTTISGTDYDIALSCPKQPEYLAPGGWNVTDVRLTPATANSLLVDVTAATSSAAIPGATVQVSATGYSDSAYTESCGQAYFGSLSAGTYTVQVSAPGYTAYSGTVSVSGHATEAVTLN